MPFPLTRGDVIKLQLPGFPHLKFAIFMGEHDLGSRSTQMGLFIINSNPRYHSSKAPFQKELDQSHNNYLIYNSFADCAEIRKVPKHLFDSQFSNNSAQVVGRVDRKSLSKILELAGSCPSISNIDKKRYLS